MNSIGAKQAVTDRDRAMIAIPYHCLSLTDVYWVKLDREAVAAIGLNQIAEVDPSWFEDADVRDMFFRRLTLLREVEG